MTTVRLIASGRDADVFDLGDGRVLRRHRDGRPATKQAELLRYASAHGYPVPVLHDASGPDLVLEKLDGPEMQQVLRPWNAGRYARILADLHRRLHELPPMPGLESAFGEPEALLHLDLHPRNVLLTSRGPVVIDWANAANGPGQADVALMYVIGKTSRIDGPLLVAAVLGTLRDRFIDAFLAGAADTDFARVLPAVAQWRKRDRNVTADERAAIDRLLARVTLEG
jgi:aminoglycoside phosphotransferase (APT) family kinase protein